MNDNDYSKFTNKQDAVHGFKKTGKGMRPPMPREQRAKQFAPFDALTGLHARLARAEEEHRAESEAGELIHVEMSISPNESST